MNISLNGFSPSFTAFSPGVVENRAVENRVAENHGATNTENGKAETSGPRTELSKEEQQEIKELQKRDREVKTHEAAHKAAGGNLTGPAHYSYTTGPDGRRYVTGGEVSVDTSEVEGDPHATLIKANRIRSAALAPAEPSGKDQQVAAKAAQMAANARAELAKESATTQTHSEQGVHHALQARHRLYSQPQDSGSIVDEMV